MSPSQFAATNILPLLARIVLCMAFLPQGWNNLMRDVEYTARDAQRLRELGVRGITDPDPRKADVALGAIRGWEAFEPQDQMPGAASGKQAAPSGATGAAAPAAPLTKPAAQDAGATGTVPAPAVERPATTPALSPLAPLTQRGLYTLTLLADRARIPFPVEMAWAVAGVQLVGGACVVLGLFSRVWGLLMSVILAALFVTTSLPVIKAQGPFSLGAEQQNMVLAQLGLFVLALGAFLVGPGAMSLDRAIFRRSRRTPGKGKSKSA
jgi:uncharacterized membrane protein YphA (DoxX/SURF4 family)